jgi:hypothetical protein
MEPWQPIRHICYQPTSGAIRPVRQNGLSKRV